MGSVLQHRLAQLTVATNALPMAPILQKAKVAEECLALALLLLGELVERVEQLEKELHQ